MILWLAAWPAASLAQDDDPTEAADPLKPQGVAVTEQGAVELHVAELPLSEVLQLLSLGVNDDCDELLRFANGQDGR